MYFLNNFLYLGQMYKYKLWKIKGHKNVKYLPPKPIFCSTVNQTLVFAKKNVGTNIMLKVYKCSRAWWDLASSSTAHHTVWKLSISLTPTNTRNIFLCNNSPGSMGKGRWKERVCQKMGTCWSNCFTESLSVIMYPKGWMKRKCLQRYILKIVTAFSYQQLLICLLIFCSDFIYSCYKFP